MARLNKENVSRWKSERAWRSWRGMPTALRCLRALSAIDRWMDVIAWLVG